MIGVWRLHHTEQKMSDGTSRANPIYGRRGIGYLIYDRTHHMCVFLTNPDGVKPAVDWPRGDPGSTMWNSSIYCGPWSYDPVGPAIIHRPDVDTTTPENTAVVRRRPFQVDGRMLTLRSDRALAPDFVENKLIFEKVGD